MGSLSDGWKRGQEEAKERIRQREELATKYPDKKERESAIKAAKADERQKKVEQKAIEKDIKATQKAAIKQSAEHNKSDRTFGEKAEAVQKRLNTLARAVGIAAILAIVGLITFPLGIIAWVIGFFVLLGGIGTFISGNKQ